MSMHITAIPGEIADRILLPGDPLRAKYIAETYLEDAVLFNELRGMLGYTGTYKGQRVSVMGTGMGVPSIVIYATELCRDYGVERLVRLGTSGAFDPRLKVYDIVLSMATSTTSAINDYVLPGHYAPTADFELLHTAYHKAQEMGFTVWAGNTMCNDLLYIDNKPEYAKKWLSYGVIASEMEGAGLYTTAARFGKKALTMMSISQTADYKSENQMSPEQKERALDNMIKLALETTIG